MVETQQRQFCTFRIHGRLYGVDIQDVQEINPGVNFTPISHAPESVKGYVNIRGQIFLLLNLRRILGLEDKTSDEDSRVVLFKQVVGEYFGILVDQIADILTVEQGQIENRRQKDRVIPEGEERRGVDIADGICRLKKELLVVISARTLLHTIGGSKNR